MGPQPFGCGRLTVDALPAPSEVASMGPQPFGCGRRMYGQTLLRLGTRFNGAATFRLRKAASIVSK